MIALGMPVQIRRSGTTVPVQALEIGDLLYDPLHDNYVEIVDILSRNTARLGHRIARIPAGRLGNGAPRQDIVSSRQQPILFADRDDQTGPAKSSDATARLQIRSAHLLGEEVVLETTLFALFPERPAFICVGGALFKLLDPSELTDPSRTNTGAMQ